MQQKNFQGWLLPSAMCADAGRLRAEGRPQAEKPAEARPKVEAEAKTAGRR